MKLLPALRRVVPWRRGPTRFQRAADGSMTLMEHLMELRTRLFRSSLALILGMILAWLFLANPVFELLQRPYCRLDLESWEGVCPGLQQLGALDAFMVKLKLSLWVGLVMSAPIWFYQLWAFIAPGLHRNERKWTYLFVGIAVPLFVAGALLAYVVIERGLRFLITYGVDVENIDLELSSFITFVATVMLVFAIGFELPLLVLMLNFAGIVSAQRLLSWWRVAVFVSFVFASFATPDPSPFGMIMLATILSAMYFLAVGIAFLNDRRKGRKDPYANLSDDEISPLDDDLAPIDEDDELEPVSAGDPVRPSTDMSTRPAPEHRHYDDLT